MTKTLPFTTEIRNRFLEIVNMLSPENISCDGECSPADIQYHTNRLNKEWADLEVKVGRTVDEDEIWSWTR